MQFLESVKDYRLPVEDHPVFQQPSDNTRLWRYMSFAKFASMITKRSLWFPNIEMLVRDDPFEAILPRGNYLHREWKTIHDIPDEDRDRVLRTKYTGSPESETPETKMHGEQQIRELRIRQAFAYRRSYFASCWHSSEYESAAMWKVYGDIQNAIAIVSSGSRLKTALQPMASTIYFGEVRYLDYENDSLDIRNSLIPIVHKRKSFEYEKEVRLVICRSDIVCNIVKTVHQGRTQEVFIGKEIEEIEAQDLVPGLQIPCDLDVLIDEIRVSPTCDKWFQETVEDFCAKTGISAPIVRSNMMKQPLR